MSQELFDAIRADADRFGMTWNEAAERALSRAFLSPGDLQNQAESVSKSQGAFDG